MMTVKLTGSTVIFAVFALSVMSQLYLKHSLMNRYHNSDFERKYVCLYLTYMYQNINTAHRHNYVQKHL